MRLCPPAMKHPNQTPAPRFRLKLRPVLLFLLTGLLLLVPEVAWASSDPLGHRLLGAIGVSILAATVLGYVAYLLKQPLLLAYIAAGAAIGPQFGFGWVQTKKTSASSPRSA